MSTFFLSQQDGARFGGASFVFRGNLLRTPMLRGLRATQAIRPF